MSTRKSLNICLEIIIIFWIYRFTIHLGNGRTQIRAKLPPTFKPNCSIFPGSSPISTSHPSSSPQASQFPTTPSPISSGPSPTANSKLFLFPRVSHQLSTPAILFSFGLLPNLHLPPFQFPPGFPISNHPFSNFFRPFPNCQLQTIPFSSGVSPASNSRYPIFFWTSPQPPPPTLPVPSRLPNFQPPLLQFLQALPQLPTPNYPFFLRCLTSFQLQVSYFLWTSPQPPPPTLPVPSRLPNFQPPLLQFLQALPQLPTPNYSFFLRCLTSFQLQVSYFLWTSPQPPPPTLPVPSRLPNFQPPLLQFLQALPLLPTPNNFFFLRCLWTSFLWTSPQPPTPTTHYSIFIRLHSSNWIIFWIRLCCCPCFLYLRLLAFFR